MQSELNFVYERTKVHRPFSGACSPRCVEVCADVITRTLICWTDSWNKLNFGTLFRFYLNES